MEGEHSDLQGREESAEGHREAEVVVTKSLHAEDPYVHPDSLASVLLPLELQPHLLPSEPPRYSCCLVRVMSDSFVTPRTVACQAPLSISHPLSMGDTFQEPPVDA